MWKINWRVKNADHFRKVCARTIMTSRVAFLRCLAGRHPDLPLPHGVEVLLIVREASQEKVFLRCLWVEALQPRLQMPGAAESNWQWWPTHNSAGSVHYFSGWFHEHGSKK